MAVRKIVPGISARRDSGPGGISLMKRKLLAFGVVAIGLALGSGAALAHHGDAGRYNETVITLTGTVVAFRMVNPHSITLVDVDDDNGEIVTWQVEGFSANALVNRGWTRETLKPGDRITMTGRPLMSGAPFINVTEKARVVLTETGEEILRSRDFVETDQ